MIRTGERLYIRPFEIGDLEALLALMLRNRQLFEQVVPTRLESFYTMDHQASSIELWKQTDQEGRRYSFGIFLKGTDELIGEASLFEIVRGPLQKAMLGYCLDAGYNSKGYMTEAIHLCAGLRFPGGGTSSDRSRGNAA
jgi:ribosomal-protein-alanine N-acetyltransferase